MLSPGSRNDYIAIERRREMNKRKRVGRGKLFVIALILIVVSMQVLFPAGVFAENANESDTEEWIGLIEDFSRTTETFNFNGNIPVSPSIVTSSAKTLTSGIALKANLQETTNNKAVKMRVIDSSGNALTGWKSAPNGTTTSLYTPPKSMQVKVQLQSSQTYVMRAVGVWSF